MSLVLFMSLSVLTISMLHSCCLRGETAFLFQTAVSKRIRKTDPLYLNRTIDPSVTATYSPFVKRTSASKVSTSPSTSKNSSCASTTKKSPSASTSKYSPSVSTYENKTYFSNSKIRTSASTSIKSPSLSISKKSPSASTSKNSTSGSTPKKSPSASTSKKSPSACTLKISTPASTLKISTFASNSKISISASTSKNSPSASTSKISNCVSTLKYIFSTSTFKKGPSASASKKSPSVTASKKSLSASTSKYNPSVSTYKNRTSFSTSKIRTSASTSIKRPSLSTSKKSPSASASKNSPSFSTTKKSSSASISKISIPASALKKSPSASTLKKSPSASTSKKSTSVLNSKVSTSPSASKESTFPSAFKVSTTSRSQTLTNLQRTNITGGERWFSTAPRMLFCISDLWLIAVCAPTGITFCILLLLVCALGAQNKHQQVRLRRLERERAIEQEAASTNATRPSAANSAHNPTDCHVEEALEAMDAPSVEEASSFLMRHSGMSQNTYGECASNASLDRVDAVPEAGLSSDSVAVNYTFHEESPNSHADIIQKDSFEQRFELQELQKEVEEDEEEMPYGVFVGVATPPPLEMIFQLPLTLPPPVSPTAGFEAKSSPEDLADDTKSEHSYSSVILLTTRGCANLNKE